MPSDRRLATTDFGAMWLRMVRRLLHSSPEASVSCPSASLRTVTIVSSASRLLRVQYVPVET